MAGFVFCGVRSEEGLVVIVRYVCYVEGTGMGLMIFLMEIFEMIFSDWHRSVCGAWFDVQVSEIEAVHVHLIGNCGRISSWFFCVPFPWGADCVRNRTNHRVLREKSDGIIRFILEEMRCAVKRAGVCVCVCVSAYAVVGPQLLFQALEGYLLPFTGSIKESYFTGAPGATSFPGRRNIASEIPTQSTWNSIFICHKWLSGRASEKEINLPRGCAEDTRISCSRAYSSH